MGDNYFNYYEVTEGDTLTKIANNFNISPKLLAELNGINISDYIYPKEVLLIPKPGSTLYITSSGDTINSIANGFKLKPEELLKQNPNIYLQEGQLIIYKYI